MANNFNDMLIDLFGAIDKLTASHIDKLKFDKTITAEIIDSSNKAKGEYVVSDGSSTFKAYSENMSYPPGTWVYIQIPNGDFNNQKIITGKYINNNTEYYTYVAPLDTYVDITNNVINSGLSSSGLVANGSKTFITLWEQTDFPDGKGYDRLGLKAGFRSWLSSAKIVKGNYGLRLDIIGEEVNTTQTEPSFKRYSFKLDSKDFYGDVYNFETFYDQEVVFDISQIDKIIAMRLVFYQDNNFINDKGEKITAFLEPEVELDNNIFVQNPQISLGYDLDNFDEDMVLLYTLDSSTYANYLTGKVKEEIAAAAQTGASSAIQHLYNSNLNEIKSIDIELEKLKVQYETNLNNVDTNHPDYQQIIDDINNQYENDYNILNNKKNEITQSLYNGAELNNPETFENYLNEINSKTLQLRWIHIDENGKMKSIDSEEKMPEGAKIHWYQYVLEEGVADELAGPFWKEVFPQNPFRYENFIPNPQKPFEQFKIIVECLSQKYVETLIEDDEDIIRLRKLVNDNIDVEENSLLIEEIEGAYYELVNFYECYPLTLENETAVPDQATVDLIKGLEIVCDEAGYGGIYNIYTENGDIMALSEANTKRILSAKYNTLITGQNIFDTAEKITWRIPINNTMIVNPTEGVEYFFYDLVYISKPEDLIPNYHYTRTLEGEYEVVDEGAVYNPQTTYYVKNNTQVVRREDLGYVDIIRYGVVSSRETGSEEADSTEQYFRIKPFYTQAATNNTVYCIINKNNKEYISEFSMAFGPVGTNGTDYTLTLEIENAVPAMNWETKESIKIIPHIYNYEREDITNQFNLFRYSWHSLGGGGLTVEPLTGIISFNETVQDITTNSERPVEIKDCYYYILKCSVDTQVEIKEEKVKTTVDGEEVDNTPKFRKITLTAFLPIPIQRNSKWTSFNGVSKICYDLTGTNPNYYKDKCSLYYYDENEKITKKDENITWEISLGVNTGYSESKSEVQKANIVKCYPHITPSGYLTATSLFMHDNGTQVAIIGKSDIDTIEWVQPIHIYQDSYSSSALNAWDGSLSIDEENGKILSTMIGAGKKDANNRFNGILMGDVSVAGEQEGYVLDDASDEERRIGKQLSEYYSGIGLYGYNSGVKSFGLNINGKAFFGKPGNGQILIDGDSGSIQSRKYIETKNKTDNSSEDDKAGMMIDLDKGSINTYGEGTKAAITIDPAPANNSDPYFEVRSKAGNGLLHIGEKYYLQSDDYQEEAEGQLGSGLHFDLIKGKLNAYNFSLKATDTETRSYLQIDSDGNPYLKIYNYDTGRDDEEGYNGINLVNITKNNLEFCSPDWRPATLIDENLSATTNSVEIDIIGENNDDETGTITENNQQNTVAGGSTSKIDFEIDSANTKLNEFTNGQGTKISLNNGNSEITSYNFKLQAGTNKEELISIDSKASTYPFMIGGYNNFSVSWNGNLISKGASIYNAKIVDAAIGTAEINKLQLKTSAKGDARTVSATTIKYVYNVSLTAEYKKQKIIAEINPTRTAVPGSTSSKEYVEKVNPTRGEITYCDSVSLSKTRKSITVLRV